MSSSANAELSGNISAMLQKISQHTAEIVSTNVPHATATTNAWRDSITQLAQTASALSLLCTQAHSTESSIPQLLRSKSAASSLHSSLQTVTDMKLVFDTATRQALRQKAIKSLTDCHADVKALESAPGSSSSSASSSIVGSTQFRSSPTAAARPLPTLYGPGASSGSAAADADKLAAGAAGLKGTSIKPQSFMTFSSLESSASARLGGVTGKCVMCGAPRSANDGAHCTSCGKNCNIVF